MNLNELLKQPEGKTLEFKRDLTSPEGALRTIVAFANTAGGTLLVGVEDRTRHVRGVADPLGAEERLANLLSDNVLPRLVPELEVLPWRRTNVLAVQVYPSYSRPHYLKSAGAERGVYVRVGSSNRQADKELIAELRRFASGESYDEEPLVDLDSEAIDFRAASELFAPKRKLKRGDLDTLRVMTKHQGRKVPTVGGLLLFGRDREQRFPDAWIQAGRFDGIEKVRLIDTLNIHSSLPEAVEEAIGFVQKHDLHGIDIRGARNTDTWTLPPAAVREAIVNAAVHADYSQKGAPIRIAFFDDRLEVENPGMLPFGLTVQDLHDGVSRLRNRVVGRVFRELGYVEQWGSGIRKMIAACRDAGVAEPRLEEIGTRFRVTIRRGTAARRPLLDDIDLAIVAALSSGTGLSTNEIAAQVGRTPRATRTRLLALVGRGVVQEIGSSLQDPKRRYFLVPSPPETNS
ncbi:MAG: putative DNA binding domain-containing protein [Proteobacteria bacterium]|nr:putative DNA binding domain-containing protein [Pseudomonadota bacterium]